MADMQAIIDGIYTKLTTDQSAGTLYDDVDGRIGNAQPTQDQPLPFVSFFFPVTPVFLTFGSSNSHGSVLQVDIYHDADSGAKACRALADKAFSLLNRSSITATGWNGVRLLCVERGDPEREEDAFRVMQQYTIAANAA